MCYIRIHTGHITVSTDFVLMYQDSIKNAFLSVAKKKLYIYVMFVRSDTHNDKEFRLSKDHYYFARRQCIVYITCVYKQ